MIKFINTKGWDNLTQFDTKGIKLESVKTKESKYFGKPPIFYIQIDPLTKKDLDFDENIYLKLFITSYNINSETLFGRLNENIMRSKKLYQSNFLNGKENNTMMIYFNMITLLHVDQNNEKLKYLYKPIANSPGLNKFPDLYLKLLTEYNKVLLNDSTGTEANNSSILSNLVNIASVRDLTKEEEEYINTLIY